VSGQRSRCVSASKAAAIASWLALAAVTATRAASGADLPADIVLLHGRIHTEDPSRNVVQALALRGNTIVAVGTDQAVSAFIGPSTRTIDLGGKLVLPGIIDAHTHPAESALDLGKCSLADKMLTLTEIKAKVALCLKERPADRALWFEVIDVNPSGLTLTLADLDAMLADRPMLLNGSDGHTIWANSTALAAASMQPVTRPVIEDPPTIRRTISTAS
jgi:predicted amidohydrolase YtcJ